MGSPVGVNPGTLIAGRKVVTTAGTAEVLTTTKANCYQLDIVAEEDNTGKIVVGDSGAVAALATRKGVYLAPGDTYTLYEVDVSTVYIDTTVNGDGVTWAGAKL